MVALNRWGRKPFYGSAKNNIIAITIAIAVRIIFSFNVIREVKKRHRAINPARAKNKIRKIETYSDIYSPI
jgi:hypothetical protein